MQTQTVLALRTGTSTADAKRASVVAAALMLLLQGRDAQRLQGVQGHS